MIDVSSPEYSNAQKTISARDYANELGVPLSGSLETQMGEGAARKLASMYYGYTPQIGMDAADYRARIKSRVDQPSALAGRFTQVSNQELAKKNAKAGMAGINDSASRIKERRANISKSNEIAQTEQRQNLMDYGKSIGAGISGTEALAAAGAGRAIAATPTPTPSYGGGLFGSIICTELYRQKKMTLKDLAASRDFRDKLQDEVYFGYLVVAKPLVKLMKKSDLFSNLFIGWAKSISAHNPGPMTKIMIPVCGLIGKIYLGVRNGSTKRIKA